MKIGVIAPGYAMKHEQLTEVVARLTAAGHEVRVHPQCYEKHLAYSGTDAVRRQGFLDYINDQSLDVVMTTRAAHGVTRFINSISPADIAPTGPTFVGYSDQTTLCWFLSGFCNRRSVYGPILRQVYDQVTPAEIDAIFAAVESPATYDYQKLVDDRTQVIVPGTATGELIGGNLTTLQQLIGTRYQMQTAGRILFFEDLDESLHHIDRMLWHMKNAGMFDNLAGVALGRMLNCGSEDTDYGTDIMGVLHDHFAGLGRPFVMNLATGHNTIHGEDAKTQTPKVSIPYLGRVQMVAEASGKVSLMPI